MLTLVPKSKQPALNPGVIAAGLRAFFAIAEKWKLTNDQARVLLGQPSRATFFKWKKGEVGNVSSSVDLAARLSYVLGIFKALEILYQDPALADRWVRQPNLSFGGNSALDRMMGGQIADLAAVRDYLDSARSGW